MMKLQSPTIDDLDGIRSILRNFDLVLEGIEENLPDFQILVEGEHIVGCVGLEIYDDVALLRSLAVDRRNQRQGLGLKLVERIETHARDNSVSTLFLLTETAEEFFKKIGYVQANRENAPRAIAQTKEFSEICPVSSAFLKKEL